MDTPIVLCGSSVHWRKCRLENLAGKYEKTNDGPRFSEENVEKSRRLLSRQVGKFMLKDKAQPIVVDELTGRIGEDVL